MIRIYHLEEILETIKVKMRMILTILISLTKVQNRQPKKSRQENEQLRTWNFLIKKTPKKYTNAYVSWQHSGNMVAPGNTFVVLQEHMRQALCLRVSYWNSKFLAVIITCNGTNELLTPDAIWDPSIMVAEKGMINLYLSHLSMAWVKAHSGPIHRNMN